jgi:hypothetical protein
MSTILDNATKHFRSKLDGTLEKIEVPEWDTVVYFYPTTALREESQILRLQQEGKSVEALVMSLIVKARNADGSKMFVPADKVTLMNEVDPKVILRVAAAINGVDSDTLDDVEKN